MKSLVKVFSMAQLFITLFGFGILLYWRDVNSAASFAVGGGLVLVNVLSWSFLISRILNKKLIALSATIIVFKYAILGVLLYKLLTFQWMDRLWFCVGLGSLIVSALLYVSFSKSEDSEDDEKFNE